MSKVNTIISVQRDSEFSYDILQCPNKGSWEYSFDTVEQAKNFARNNCLSSDFKTAKFEVAGKSYLHLHYTNRKNLSSSVLGKTSRRKKCALRFTGIENIKNDEANKAIIDRVGNTAKKTIKLRKNNTCMIARSKMFAHLETADINSYQKSVTSSSNGNFQKLQKHFTVTEDSLCDVKQMKMMFFGNQRNCSQASVFNNTSANKAASDCGLMLTYNDEEVPYEWTHLGAYEFLGVESQVKDNLVLATAACNVAMMHIEGVIRKLVIEGHTVQVSASADIVKGSQLNECNMITYEVRVNKGQAITFYFDPKSVTPPDVELHKSMEQQLRQTMVINNTSCHDAARDMMEVTTPTPVFA